MIINPFTRQVLNANPKGCNQYSGPDCLEGSYKAIEQEAGIPVKYGSDQHSAYHPSRENDPVMKAVLKELGMIEGPAITVKKGPLERAIAAHETGHHKSGHVDENWYASQEREAWRWALKNRKKLAVSKKKIRQAIRQAELSGGLPRNTLMKGQA